MFLLIIAVLMGISIAANHYSIKAAQKKQYDRVFYLSAVGMVVNAIATAITLPTLIILSIIYAYLTGATARLMFASRKLTDW